MPTILLVDESPEDGQAVGRLLVQKNGYAFEQSVNYSSALERIQSAAPDVVLVDPSVEGIESRQFISAVRQASPHTPVVVVAAKGSEERAVRALQAGAASYVPKHLLEDHLHETIRAVMRATRHERQQNRVMELLSSLQCTFVLHNDLALVSPLVGYIQERMERMSVCDEAELTRVGIAIHEALTNAILHGNLELDSDVREESMEYVERITARASQVPYADRHVHVLIDINGDRALLRVRDEGPGFDPHALPDPTDPEHVDHISGRGVFLIHTFMDEVTFNDVGNEITMVKRRHNSSHQDR